HWLFTEGCASTPEQMAAAGFIHCPSENGPDVVQCFCCFKELEGWEPDDDPIDDPVDLTLQEFKKLNKERMRNVIKKQISQKVTEFNEDSQVRFSIRQIIVMALL
uniref:BIRC5 n=1 Tax=Chelydra serpentina TaxID=8475 RepID=A0A8C3S3T9_CHESE